MDCEVNRNNLFISQTYSVSTFEEFKLKLKEHETATGTKFIFVKSSKKFEDVKVALSKPNLRIHWKDNLPYLNLGSTLYACHQGKDYNLYNKKKYEENRVSKASRRPMTTKKMNCPVKVLVTKVLKFMDHKLTGTITNFKKNHCSKQIKISVKIGADLKWEECYIFNLPTEEEHKYHLIGQQSSGECPRRFKNYKKKKTARSRRAKTTGTGFGGEHHILNLPTEEEHTYHSTVQHDDELHQRGCSEHKVQLINDINSTIRSVQSVMWNLNESELVQAKEVLKNLLKTLTSKVSSSDYNGIPIPIEAPVDEIQSSYQNSREKTNSKLSLQQKTGCDGGVIVNADISIQPRRVYVLQKSSEGLRLKNLKLIPISFNNSL